MDLSPIRILVYQSLFSFIRDTVSLDPLRITRRLIYKLSAHYDTMSGKDSISAIVKSPESRKILKQLSAELGIDTEAGFRVALREDEERVAKYILDILNSESRRASVFVLEPDSGQIFIDIVQNTLDKGLLPDKKHQAMARKMIMKLSAEYDKLPSGLSIAAPVTGREEHATAHGGFGDIYRAVYIGKAVALKCMRTNLRGDDLRQIRRRFCQEAFVWQRLQHPFILPLIGIDVETFSPFPCMVSPWMEHGTVLEYLNDYGRGNVDKFLCEIAQGLQYLHVQKIVHGDLRGANILVTNDSSACLADFGLAQFSEAANTVSSLNRAGSTRWMAPELLNPGDFGLRFDRTTATDIYAFGCICLELYTGSPPFAGLSDGAVIHAVIAGKRPEQPGMMSDALWQYVCQYWAQDPALRPTAGVFVEDTIALITAGAQHKLRPVDATMHGPTAADTTLDHNVLELASRIGFEDNEMLRQALKKDYERVLARFVGVIKSPEAVEAALGLTGEDAEDFLDDLQSILPDFPEEHRSKARQTLLGLFSTSKRLPSSIFIAGVIDIEGPIFGGGFADIYRAMYRGKAVAVKRLHSYMNAEDVWLRFCREALVWQNLKNPYILPLIGIDRDSFSPALCMVSPWMELGTSLKYLRDNGRRTVNKLLSEVAQGLMYLHSQNVVHGDLRGVFFFGCLPFIQVGQANILITQERTACLTDFGLSTFVDQETASSSTHAGSLRWMAPELIYPEKFGLDKFTRTPASDMYSFGCVCLELYTGQAPFSDITPEVKAMLKIVEGERPERPDGQPAMSDELWDHVNTYWAQDPSSRPSAQSAVENMAQLVR